MVESGFSYDPAGGLTSAGYPDGSSEVDQYDDAGNRTVITSTVTLTTTDALSTTVTSNSYDAADELTSASTASDAGPGEPTTYSYDTAGNQTGSVGPTGTITNTYDLRNELVAIIGPTTNLTFVYDGQGDRLRSYDASSGTPTLSNYAQDLEAGMSDLVSDGNADYAYLDPGSGQAPLAGYTLSTQRSTTLGTDLLGSVRLVTDPTGATIGAGAYDAWGNARANPDTSTGSGVTLLAGMQGSQPFGFAGQYYDAAAGTYDMRAREYSPSEGQFESEDPLLDQTNEPYRYAGDRPTDATDPSGKIVQRDMLAESGLSIVASSMPAAGLASTPEGDSEVEDNNLTRSQDALLCAVELYRQAGYSIASGPNFGAAQPGRIDQWDRTIDPQVGMGWLLAKGDSARGPDFIAYRGSLPGHMDLVAVEVKYRSDGSLSQSDFPRAYGNLVQGSMAWVNASTRANCASSTNPFAKWEGCFWQRPYGYFRAVCGQPASAADQSILGNNFYMTDSEIEGHVTRRTDLVGVLTQPRPNASGSGPFSVNSDVYGIFRHVTIFTDDNVSATLSKNPIATNCNCRQNQVELGTIIISAARPGAPGWPALHGGAWCLFSHCWSGAYLSALFGIAYIGLPDSPEEVSVEIDNQYDDSRSGGQQHFSSWATKTYAASGFLIVADIHDESFPRPDARHTHFLNGKPVLIVRFHLHNFNVDGVNTDTSGRGYTTIAYNLPMPN